MNDIQYNKLEQGIVVRRFNLSSTDAIEVDPLLEAKHRRKNHGNSKEVLIWGPVNEVVYRERIKQFGAKPITEHLFPSSKAASLHLGFKTDQVGYALRRAKQLGTDAEIAGVTFRRVEDIHD